jgi:hypothetical protein
MIDATTVARGLERLTQWFGRHDAWSCGMAFATGPVFEESYGVRAALLADKVMGIGRVREIALSFCDRALLFQGHVEKDMYYMGYGNNLNAEGIPGCSCVADASSTAMAVVETLQAFPDAPRSTAYLQSVRRFVDYVLATHRGPDGVIGVGILGHKKNLWSQYWCANSLFACVILGLAELTGDEGYYEAAVAPLEYLARYDYRTTVDKQWELSPTEMVFYASEGILAGLESPAMQARLAREPRGFAVASGASPSVAPEAAANRKTFTQSGQMTSGGASIADLLRARWGELAAWLRANQDPDGSWPTTKPYSCYQAGMSWTMLRGMRVLGGQSEIEGSVARHLSFLTSPRARPFLGLFCNLFASALAYLSLAASGAVCHEREPAALEAALHAARVEAIADPW